MTFQLHLHIQPNETGAALLGELLAEPETREMLAERLEEHFSGALRDAVYDLLPYRTGVDDCQFEVSVDNDTLAGLVLAVQAALHAVQQGKGDALEPLLTAALARATNGMGTL
jgi:hypothetical protein